jgi:dimethylhistidine N-methyltransferase
MSVAHGLETAKARTDPDERLSIVRVPCASETSGFAGAVRSGLGAMTKSLPCRFFYDDAGSRLFEEICSLPEYYATRIEREILLRAAPEIAEAAGAGTALAELGSGSSAKTRLLIEALLARQEELHYVPIDISAAFLEESARALLGRFPGLRVTAIGGEYLDAVPHLPRRDGPLLVLFLGGNVGNLGEDEAASFLAGVAAGLSPRDRLLVGFDRLKERAVIERAYDDGAGVTAAFNRNLLARINRELGGEFDLDTFDHAAPFIPERSRIEMHLVSRRPQAVRVAALGQTFSFERGETIHTENSHKYDLAGIDRLCGAAGLAVVRLWSDPREWFSLALLAPAGGREA